MSLGSVKILSANELERYRVRLERTLPVRGKKEFAPSGSWVERKQLEAARDERHGLLKEERVERVGTLSVAEWDEKMNVAVVTYSVGKHWENFGHQQGQIKCLHPEEALFLLETSNLLLLHNNVGLSVQQGYNTLLGPRTGCTLNCYRVFSHLARQGFRLKRHAGPVFALTDYERRIGLESYLYPSRRSIPSVQGQPIDEHGDSANAESHENTVRKITMSSEGNDNERATNYIHNQHAETLSEGEVKTETLITQHSDILSEGQIKTETLIPEASEAKWSTSSGGEIICNSIKNEDIELQKAHEFDFCTNSTVADIGKQLVSSPYTNCDNTGTHQRTGNSSEMSVSKTSCNRGMIVDDIHNIKHEQETDDVLYEVENNESNVAVCDINMKTEENSLQENVAKDRIASETTSRARSLIDKIKEESILTENNCDISMDSTDCIIESVEELQEVDKHLNSREPQENLVMDRERIASETTSRARSLVDKIKEEILNENNCVSMDSTDRIIESVEELQEVDKHLNSREPQENVVMARERIASETSSRARSLIDKIKEEILNENNCDISMDSTDSSCIIESVEELQEVDKHLNSREPQENVVMDRERIASETTSRARSLVDEIKEEVLNENNCDISMDSTDSVEELQEVDKHLNSREPQENVVNDRERIASETTSTARSLIDKIKEESILTENNCDISMDSTDSPCIIESVEELQEVDKHLNSREPPSELIKKENLKTPHEICLISDSSVSGFSDIVDHEEGEQNKNSGKTPHLPPLVNLVGSNENKLCGLQSKMSDSQDLVIIDELPVTPRLKMSVGEPSTSNTPLKCEVEITNICSAKESGATVRTRNRKTVGGQRSSTEKSMKCEIDITDISSAEENTRACSDISSNKGVDILCVDHKHKTKRKRRISQRRSSVKSEKSYVVDVETGTLMHADNNVVPRKVPKREKQKEISEVIVVDDIDTHSENDETIVLKDDDLELELIKFYEEITLIDLTVEDSRTQTRAEILDMFPNFAGVKIATVRVPPSELLPENVAPSQQEYQIDLQKLLSDRPDWIVRRRPYRGRGGYQRFRPRRGHFRHQQYQGSPHRHMADERNYVDPHAISEEFSRNVRLDYDRQSPSQNYSNSFGYPTQDNMSFAVIDTSGDFSHVKRFGHQQSSFQGRSNKQWYANTWNTGSQSDGFMQHSDAPSASPQHYELMNVDNRFPGHQHNQQRWNRRYHRNPSNRRNPSGRSKFRSYHHPAPYRHTPRTVNFQEQTTEYDWQNVRNVCQNAESWSHFKKLISGKNCEEPSVQPKLETPMKEEECDNGAKKVEENDDGAVKVEEKDDSEEEEVEQDEEEPQVDSLDEEAEEEDVEWKPLLQPSDCTHIGSILQKLNIFKEVVCDKVHIAHYETELKINYDIYLPTTKFKKSSPCLPDYRLCVIGCEQEVPSPGEISFLLKELKNDIPVPLLFAVVVPDGVSFYHFVNISLPVDDSCPA